MNGWFVAAGTLLAAASFVHTVSGSRFYAQARPCRESGGGAYGAWLLGRCGFQLVTTDLVLGAAAFLSLGFGALPRSLPLELFLTAVYGGWSVAWPAALRCERASARYWRRLCHWVFFCTVAALAGIGAAH